MITVMDSAIKTSSNIVPPPFYIHRFRGQRLGSQPNCDGDFGRGRLPALSVHWTK